MSSAAAIPFGTFDLVKSQAAVGRLRGFDRAFSTYGTIPNFLVNLAVKHFEKRFDDIALELAERTLAFERMAERLEAEPKADFIDESGVLGRDLTEFIDRLRELAARINTDELDLSSARVGGRRWRVRQAMQRVQQSAVAAAGAGVDLRAAVDSHDANVEAILRARSGARCAVATSEAELSNQLGAAFKR